jgi:DUF1009 family protein
MHDRILFFCCSDIIYSFSFRTQCGLPFKKLDKKSEKQFLFDRRQRLTERLQKTTDPGMVADLTIMLLFQQVKQVVVAGSLLRGPILSMLEEERKISEQVATVLRSLVESVEGNKTVDDLLLGAVKDCGLARDISKHEMPDIGGEK